jgi:antirestriction protein ArdC
VKIEQFDEELTALVVKAIEEKNIAPWRKPWTGGLIGPTNFATRKEYRGANLMTLAIHEMCLGYKSSYWVGLGQANALGGKVLKGSKGVTIMLPLMHKVEDKATGDVKYVSTGKFKSATVFNLDQTTIEVPAIEERQPVETLPALQMIIDGYKNRPEIFEREQGRAYYDLKADAITLPAAHQWTSAEDRAYTTLHELTHSTGHESRIGRFKDESVRPARFGDGSYAFEELVADIGAQILMDHAGIPVDMKNSVAYLAGWLQPLKNDTSLIRTAATAASKGTEWILEKARDPQLVTA